MLSANSNQLEFRSCDGFRKGITDFRRIRLAPLPLQTKANLIACLVGPAALYSCPAGDDYTLRLINSPRRAVVAAPWGTKRRSICREMVLTLFAKGHFVDPLQNAAYQSLRQLRRMAEQRPEAFAELERVWHCYATGGAMCDGPVAVTCNIILRWMGWHWHLERHRSHSRRWQVGHQQSAEHHQGHHQNRKKTTLHELRCGCVWTQTRQFDGHRADSPMCPFCGEEPEDEDLMPWRCTQWETLRRKKTSIKQPGSLGMATVHLEV